MSRIGTIARRTFLIGCSAIAGGVAFGIYRYKRAVDNPLLKNLSEDEAALTPYVLIRSQGISLVTPRADMGQGAYSVQAMLIAEELDVELDQISVDPGPPDPAYYNSALANDGVPFMATDESFLAESMRGVSDVFMKFLGMQITGASTTVPDGFIKLRLAGAVARETLKSAAAKHWSVSPSDLRTSRGRVIRPDGTSIAFEALATKVAKQDLVQDVSLRDPKSWRLIGKPVRRVDIVDKSTGKANYGIDRVVPGMVYAAVRRNPTRGPLRSYDATETLAVAGVKHVFPVDQGVAVIAQSTWAAFQGADVLRCEWSAGSYPQDMTGHWEHLEAAFHEDRLDSELRSDGDVASGLDGAELIEREYKVPYLAHAPLEPLNATVLVSEDRADVWTGTQIPRFVQNNVADITGLDVDDVHVHAELQGGSFGHRLEDEVVRLASEVAVELKGTPVKLTFSREEDMSHEFFRPIAMARSRGQIRGGRIHAVDLAIAMPSVMGSQMGRQGVPAFGSDIQIVAGAWDQPFSIPHYRVRGYNAIGLAPVSSWRSVGASGNAFFHECFFDEMMSEAGVDPLEERLRICNHEPSRKVLEAVGEMANWGSATAENRGRGLAFCLSFGVPCAEIVEVEHTSEGFLIELVHVAVDVGRIVDPVNFDNQVKGAVVFGLGHAMMSEITFAGGRTEQENYDTYPAMRLYQCPEIHVRGLEHGSKVKGVGEPPVPPAAPALANAIFSVSGKRIRELPLNRHVDFV